MSFTDADQRNSRAPAGKRQSDNQQSPHYSWNYSFMMGHLYLEQLSSSREVLALPAMVSKTLIYQESRRSPANKVITLNRRAGRWLIHWSLKVSFSFSKCVYYLRQRGILLKLNTVKALSVLPNCKFLFTLAIGNNGTELFKAFKGSFYVTWCSGHFDRH